MLLIVSGTVGAHRLNRAAAESLRQTEGFLQLLRYIRTQVECFALPVSQILARCDRDLLKKCGYIRSIAPKTLSELSNACEERDRVSAGFFRDFSETFGTGYREEQCQNCDSFIALLDTRRAELQERLPDRKKMNAALCLSGALAAVIVLI